MLNLILGGFTFLLSYFLYPPTIRLLCTLAPKRIQKSLRPKMYALHKKKEGTPSMGGILALVIVPSIALLIDFTPTTGLLILSLLGFGLLGLWDDLLSTYGKKHFGFTMRLKGTIQIFLAFALSWFLLTIVPFPFPAFFEGISGFLSWSLLFLFITFTIFATANAVNFTDGLDGLAGGSLVCTFTTLLFIAMASGDKSGQTVAVFLSIVLGWLLAFLVFNKHPARVFMGDTGSMGMGALLAVSCFLLHNPFLILGCGVVFVFEAISVALQLTSKRFLGRKVFKIAPFHHHLEALGWKETKIVTTFWLSGAIVNLFILLVIYLF